jgi:outer membrane protein
MSFTKRFHVKLTGLGARRFAADSLPLPSQNKPFDFIVKNLSLTLNVVLLVAVAVLYYLHFSGRKAPAALVAGTVAAAGKDQTTNQYAYVNVDSLLTKYDYFKVTRTQLEDRRKKLETEIAGRTRSLENEVVSAQRKANTMTLEQAQLTEQNLRRKEQELMRYQNDAARQLAEEEQKKNEELINNISLYLKKHTEDKPYKIVFGYSKGGGILYATDSLDITQEVLKGLNQDYQANNQPAGAKKP